jgi:hypothetical protein
MVGKQRREIEQLLESPRARERLRALDAMSMKVGGRVVRTIDDPHVVPLLLRAIGDSDLRVRRAAARGLRPWIADDPELLPAALEVYASHSFEGGYSHAGLLDTRSGVIWVPRVQAVSGHAALLVDANTDRYFRFEFFLPAQAPAWIAHRDDTSHLVLCLVPEWSYSRQRLVPEHDERRRAANASEQARHGEAVVAFYHAAALPYEVRVHHVSGGGGHHRTRALDVGRVPAHKGVGV